MGLQSKLAYPPVKKTETQSRRSIRFIKGHVLDLTTERRVTISDPYGRNVIAQMIARRGAA